MGLWLSIPVFPGVRLSGPLLPRRRRRPIRHHRGSGTLALLIILAASVASIRVAFTGLLLVAALLLAWFVVVSARYGMCVLLGIPCRTPGVEARLLAARTRAWLARRG